MNNFLKFFLSTLIRERARQFNYLVFLILSSSFLEMLSVVSIIPYVAILAEPTIIYENADYKRLFDYLGLSNLNSIILISSLCIFCLLLFSNLIRAYTFYYSARFALQSEAELGYSVLCSYLSKNYRWFVSRSKTDLGKMILSETSTLVHSGLVPFLRMIAQITLMIVMLFALLWINPDLVLILLIGILVLYGFLFWLVKPHLRKIGRLRFEANASRFRFASEPLNLFREVKIAKAERFFSDKFLNAAMIFAETQTKSQVLAQVPKFAFELIAFAGVLFSLSYLLITGGNLLAALPYFAAYIFAVYKIIPAVQQLYASFSQLKFIDASVESVASDIFNDYANQSVNPEKFFRVTGDIQLKNMSFGYSNDRRYAISDISMIIKEKSCVGIMGESGSGKSTLISIIIGLLDPSEGTVTVGNRDLRSPLNKMSWFESIGYVAQEIELLDGSIAENIAFGLDKSEIDWDRIVESAKSAGIHEFVTSELIGGYDAGCGEGGINLSGGQRQRLGIARALYRSPDVLIFDEATSALDRTTEAQILQSISELVGRVTIVMIGHKASTMAICDEVFELRRGRLF